MERLQVLAVFCVVLHLTLGHGDHGHGGTGKPLEFASEIHNRDHILEHLQRVIATKPKDQLTEEELEFHYFKLHDYDNNNKLDGVEIGKALTHFHDGSEDKPDAKNTEIKIPVVSDEVIMATIDTALNQYDVNKDGYVEYFEFKKANKKKP